MAHTMWQMPMFTEPTGWKLPDGFPTIPPGEAISIDTETCDPGLEKGGAPASLTNGYICGVSVATSNQSWYFPTAHASGVNLDPDRVYEWVRDLAAVSEGRTVIGANLLYDLEYLAAEGIRFPKGTRFFDVQISAAILRESLPSYSLEAISQAWLGEGKVTNTLYQWIASAHKVNPTKQSCAKYIHTAPPEQVGPYAEADARLPFQLFNLHTKEILRDHLGATSRLEMRLIPVLLGMRLQGVRVDEATAEEAVRKLRGEIDSIQRELKMATGMQVDVWAEKSVTQALKNLGVYEDAPRTAKGHTQLHKEWLENHPSTHVRLIAKARDYTKLISTFLQGAVLNQAIRGRIHCQYHPTRSDDGGTVSGRFSSSNPNLQNLPSKDEWAKGIVRSVFLPEEGHVWWRFDQSQIEYRLLASDAIGEGADAIRDRYTTDPATDYHTATGDMIKERTGIELARKSVKNINFGLAYGMQVKKLSEGLGLSVEEAQPLFDAYHKALPFVQTTFNYYAAQAKVVGEVRTFNGRRRKFEAWAPFGQYFGLPREQAEAKWPGERLRRTETHKGLNQRLQGGGADVMKMGMLACAEAGLYERAGFPLVTVHDELGFSAAPDDPAMAAIQRHLETCAPTLKVPLICEPETGATWGDCG